jgi:hypothetical protein
MNEHMRQFATAVAAMAARLTGPCAAKPPLPAILVMDHLYHRRRHPSIMAILWRDYGVVGGELSLLLLSFVVVTDGQNSRGGGGRLVCRRRIVVISHVIQPVARRRRARGTAIRRGYLRGIMCGQKDPPIRKEPHTLETVCME